jgi:hypothetical protein
LLHLCLWNTTNYFKALVGAAIKFLITQNGLKLRRYGTVTRKQTITPPFSMCFLWCSFTSEAQRRFVTLQFGAYNDTKIAQFGSGMRTILENV